MIPPRAPGISNHLCTTADKVRLRPIIPTALPRFKAITIPPASIRFNQRRCIFKRASRERLRCARRSTNTCAVTSRAPCRKLQKIGYRTLGRRSQRFPPAFNPTASRSVAGRWRERRLKPSRPFRGPVELICPPLRQLYQLSLSAGHLRFIQNPASIVNALGIDRARAFERERDGRLVRVKRSFVDKSSRSAPRHCRFRSAPARKLSPPIWDLHWGSQVASACESTGSRSPGR